MIEYDNQFLITEQLSLLSLIYAFLKQNIMILEVGSWKGQSTTLFARVAKDLNGNIFCVDHWKGNETTDSLNYAKTIDVFDIFRNNLKTVHLLDYVHPMICDSKLASKVFSNETFDIIFLDADHRYSEFKQDVINWLPKVKKGGLICGHDAEKKYSNCSEDVKNIINKNLEIDICPKFSYHCGVIRALYELFNDEYEIMGKRIWYLPVNLLEKWRENVRRTYC